MRVPKPTLWATLALVSLVAACGSDGDATLHSDAPATTTSTSPVTTSTATPVPTSAPARTPVPLPSPQAMTQLWEAHGPVTDQTSTTYIAINPADGNVWVGVPFENKFWIFSPDGRYLESWGESGKGPGQFDFSDHAMHENGFASISFAPDGSFYVGDTGNNRVEHFAPDRTFIGEWGAFGAGDGQFAQIVSIATDGTTVYVGDGDHNNIQAFTTDGTYLRTIGEGDGDNSVAVGPEGRIYLTNPANPQGMPQALAVLGSDASALSRTVLPVTSTDAIQPVVDAAGNVYVNLLGNSYPWVAKGVVEFDPDGRVVQVWEGGGDFIGVAPDGKALYVARGTQLDSTQWTFVRKYALSGS